MLGNGNSNFLTEENFESKAYKMFSPFLPNSVDIYMPFSVIIGLHITYELLPTASNIKCYLLLDSVISSF
jgi:hypothetical protein